MNRMYELETELLAPTIPSILFTLSKMSLPCSGYRERMDRINKRTGCMDRNRTLGSDHPVNPVHPVKNVSALLGIQRKNGQD